MVSDRTVKRLEEAGDLLGMIEEIFNNGAPSRVGLAGVRVTLRNAREAILRSCLEIKQDETAATQGHEEPPASPPAAAPQHGLDGYTGEEGRILMRRRDLRSSIERLVER